MNVSIEVLRTDRLIGTRMREEEFDDLVRLHADQRVMATLGGLRSAEKTRAYMAECIDHWDQHGFGAWVFRRADNGAFVCRAKLNRTTIEGAEEIELGYAVQRDCWRQGCATEVSLAILRAAFETLDLEQVVAFTQPDNLASRGVIEKIGMRYERDIEHKGQAYVLYRIARPANR